MQSLSSYTVVILLFIIAIVYSSNDADVGIHDTQPISFHENNIIPKTSNNNIDFMTEAEGIAEAAALKRAKRDLYLRSSVFLLKSGKDEEAAHKNDRGLDKELSVDDSMIKMIAMKSQAPALGPVQPSDSDKKSKDAQTSLAKDDSPAPEGEPEHMASKVALSGCYTDKTKALVLVYDGNDTTVVRCAAHCANRGYPIAATSKGSQCFCAYDLPLFVDEAYICKGSTSEWKNDSVCGSGVPASTSCPDGECILMDVSPKCNKPCAGVYSYFSADGCRGTYCCGDASGKYYTVATVGELNPVRQLMRRVAMNLTSEGGKLVSRIFANAFILTLSETVTLPISWAEGPAYEAAQLEDKVIDSHGFLGSYCNEQKVTVNWNSFSIRGWSECPSNSIIVGFYRSSCDTLKCITNAACSYVCAGPSQTMLSTTACYNASWVISFNSVGFSSCKANTFMTGLFRGPGEGLESVTAAKCCSLKNESGTGAVGYNCQNVNWWSSFDYTFRWNYVYDNYFLVGLYRNDCNNLHCIELATACAVRIKLKDAKPQLPVSGFQLTPDSLRKVVDFNGDRHYDILFLDLPHQMGVVYWGPTFNTFEVLAVPALSWVDSIQDVLNATSSSDNASDVAFKPKLENVARKYSWIYQTSTPDRSFNANKCVDGITTFGGGDRSFCYGGWAPTSYVVRLKTPAYIDHVDIYTLNFPFLNLQKCKVRMIPDVEPTIKTVNIPGITFNYKGRTYTTPVRPVKIVTYEGEQYFSINQPPTVVEASAASSSSMLQSFLDTDAFFAEHGADDVSHGQFLKNLSEESQAEVLLEDDPDVAPHPDMSVPNRESMKPKMPDDQKERMKKAKKKSKKDLEKRVSDVGQRPIRQAIHRIPINMKNIKQMELFCDPTKTSRANGIYSILTMFEFEAYGISYGDAAVEVGDVTGDGVADIVAISPIGSILMDYGSKFIDPTTKAPLTPTDSSAVSPDVQYVITSNIKLDKYKKMFADVNNDNRADLISFREDGYDVAISGVDKVTSKAMLVRTESWSRNDFSSKEGFQDSSPLWIADIDNDNCADMMRINHDDSNRLFIKKSDCSGEFLPMLPVGKFQGKAGKYNMNLHPIFFADVTGDRFVDICKIGGGSVSCLFNDGKGTGFGLERIVMTYEGATFISYAATPPLPIPPSAASLAPTPAPTPAVVTDDTLSADPTPTPSPGPTSVKGIPLSSPEVAEPTLIFDRIFLVPEPGSDTANRTRVLSPSKVEVEAKDVRIELLHAYDSQIYYATQYATKDNSFIRLTRDDYKEEFKETPPTIMTSTLEKKSISRVETNTPPSTDEYLNTHDIVLENGTSTEQSMTKNFSSSTTWGLNLTIEISLEIEIIAEMQVTPMGIGGEIGIKINIELTIGVTIAWTWAATSGFSLALTIPPKKTLVARFKNQEKSVVIKFKAEYVAKGDIGLRVFKKGAAVYYTQSHLDEVLAMEQRAFSVFGTLNLGLRKQWKAEIMAVTSANAFLKPGAVGAENLLAEKNLVHCGEIHEKGYPKHFGEGGPCGGVNAHLGLTAFSQEPDSKEGFIHPHLRQIIKTEVNKDRPVVLHTWGTAPKNV